MKVAIPRIDQFLAPRFEHSTTITVFTVDDGKVVDEVDFSLQSERALDRVRLLRDKGVDTLICGGVERVVEDILQAHGIATISWASGSVPELLDRFVRGELTARTGNARTSPASLGGRKGAAGS